MPRTRSLAWSELKIGVLTIVALAIAAVTIFTPDRQPRASSGSATPEDALPERRRAGVGSPVRVAGVEVGTVTEIEFAGEQVDVTFEVNKEHRRPDHDRVGGEARIGLAARRGRRRHHAVDQGHADSGVGLRRRRDARRRQFADIAEQASEGIDEINGLLQRHARRARAPSAS